jgi:hypothetical protein
LALLVGKLKENANILARWQHLKMRICEFFRQTSIC